LTTFGLIDILVFAMSKHRRKDVFTGLVIIVVGVFFLLQNLGYIDGSIWKYWPVILIIFGISEIL